MRFERSSCVACVTWLVTLLARDVTSHSVTGTIEGNVTWFIRELSLVPAISASLQYYIRFPASMVYKRNAPVITYYYDGQDSPNLINHCETDMYGQLRNEELAVPLRVGSLYRHFGCVQNNKVIECTGRTEVQDFEPKSYSFSLASNCKRRDKAPNLNGLYYNITIHSESNTTRCVDLSPWYTKEEKHEKKRGKTLDRCERSYKYGAIPNQIGTLDVHEGLWQLRKGLGILDNAIDLFTHKTCLQGVYQFLCLVFFPECLPAQNQIVLPCKEDCVYVLNECLKIPEITKLVTVFAVNCDYLPRMNGSVPCFTHLDVCGPPPKVKHGFIVGNETVPYAPQGRVVQYGCEPSRVLIGPHNTTCLKSGQWTQPPKCGRHYNLMLIICCCVGGVTFLILTSTIVTALVCRVRRNRRDGVGDDGDGDNTSGDNWSVPEEVLGHDNEHRQLINETESESSKKEE